MTDPLSLLRAGLDEDERIARASGGDEWMDDDRFNRVDVAEGYIETSHHGPHIARQCPKATLDRVEKLRELAEYARWVMGHNDPDCSDAGRLARLVIETLASIYPEPTDETEKP